MGVGIVLIVSAILLGQIEGVFIKKYNSKHEAGGFIFTGLVSLFSMLFFVITNTDGFQFPPGMWIYSVAAGILYCGASFLTYVALGCGSYAMSMLILSYGLVFKIGYGLFFLNEPASVFTYIGLAVIFVSIYLTRGEKDKTKSKFSVKWLVCILLSVFGSGMFGVVQRMQQIAFDDTCTNEFMIIALAISAASLFIIGVIKDGKKLKSILKYGGGYAISAGVANGMNNMIGLVVNTLMPVSLSSPLRAGLRIVTVFLISKLIFKEKFLKRQVVGVFLGAVALVLLNIK